MAIILFPTVWKRFSTGLEPFGENSLSGENLQCVRSFLLRLLSGKVAKYLHFYRTAIKINELVPLKRQKATF